MRKLFLDNLWLKLAAILLALLLWFYASTDRSYEYTLSYGLELVNLSSELNLAEPLPDEIKVMITGKGKDILKLLLIKGKRLKIDAGDFPAGEHRLQIKKEMITIPEELNLSITEVITPRVLSINLQKVTEKKVPIISQLSFTPEEGYFIKGEVKFTPGKVRVSGPSEYVEKTMFILTQKKEYIGLTRPFSESIELVAPSSYNLKIFPQGVNFSVDIKKGMKTRMEKLPVKVINLSSGRTGYLHPQTINLELLGEEESISGLTPESVIVVIEGKGLKRGKTKIAPSVRVPRDIVLLKSEPDSFNLEIR
ncbi:MAG: hypothetical protein OEV55_03155 [candidate division Zixibacteria bacterium]|nr:hypothetical protein [candidate division Zixibacteria bacterium]